MGAACATGRDGSALGVYVMPGGCGYKPVCLSTLVELGVGIGLGFGK